jgi:hypothetical protein
MHIAPDGINARADVDLGAMPPASSADVDLPIMGSNTLASTFQEASP